MNDDDARQNINHAVNTLTVGIRNGNMGWLKDTGMCEVCGGYPAEYNLDLGFEEIIKENKVLTFGGDKKYVLFELSFYNEPNRLKEVVWELNTLNYQPILAHVERYPYWFKKWESIEDIVNRDVKLQVNIGSFTGIYGPEVRHTAERLVDKGMIDLLGTDCHNLRHIEMIKKAICMPYFHKACELPDLINRQL